MRDDTDTAPHTHISSILRGSEVSPIDSSEIHDPVLASVLAGILARAADLVVRFALEKAVF